MGEYLNGLKKPHAKYPGDVILQLQKYISQNRKEWNNRSI